MQLASRMVVPGFNLFLVMTGCCRLDGGADFSQTTAQTPANGHGCVFMQTFKQDKRVIRKKPTLSLMSCFRRLA